MAANVASKVIRATATGGSQNVLLTADTVKVYGIVFGGVTVTSATETVQLADVDGVVFMDLFHGAANTMTVVNVPFIKNGLRLLTGAGAVATHSITILAE